MNQCIELIKGYEKMISSGHMKMPLGIEMMVEHGKEYQLKVVKGVTGRGVAKQCYRNSENLASFGAGDYVYVEGYACKAGLIPLEHAFVLDLVDGKVIDPTWSDDDTTYFGCAFNTDFVNKHTLLTETYSVFQNLHKLRDKFKRQEDIKRYLVKGLFK